MSPAEGMTGDKAEATDLPYASCNGHGTLEMLEIVHALEKAEIDCCVVGVSALKFYGARRARDDWELCVPTEKFQVTMSLLKSKAFSEIYQEDPNPIDQMMMLYDTFPRFRRLKVQGLHFRVLSAHAAHVPCNPSSFRRSKMGIPYPKLHLYVQSRLDTRDRVNLADVIDGMDLAEDWATGNLDLSVTSESRWAEWANRRIKQAHPDASFGLISTHPIDRQAIWQKLVLSKQTRMGWKYPKDQYATRFRRHGSKDPTTRDREFV